jgi:PAS domain S-box-containing protein
LQPSSAYRRAPSRAPHEPRDGATVDGVDALAIVNTVREPLLVLDDRLHVRFVNHAFERQFGVSAEHAVGHSLWAIGERQWDHPGLRELLERVLPDRSQFDDFELAHDFGALGHRVLWLNASEIVLPASAERRILLAMEDVTERRRAAEEVAERTRELERYATVASHDLQEPLRKIRTYGALLVEECADALSEEGREYVERMSAASARMQALIDDLLMLARTSTSATRATRVELQLVVRDALADLEVALSESGGAVEVGDLPAVHADPVQMRQLFQNLLANAIKFRRPGTPPRVVVSARRAGTPSVTEVVVRDNGIGFEDRHAEQIFDAFQRLHGRHEYGGNGIGLAVCRRIVERHRGAIRAHAIVGEGSTFVVTLPVAAPAAPHAGAER